MHDNIRKATAGDAERLLYHLIRAFDDDPTANYLIRQDRKRDKGFALFFRACLCALSLPHDEVYTTDDNTGGALWLPPGTLAIPLLRQIALFPRMVRGGANRWLR